MIFAEGEVSYENEAREAKPRIVVFEQPLALRLLHLATHKLEDTLRPVEQVIDNVVNVTSETILKETSRFCLEYWHYASWCDLTDCWNKTIISVLDYKGNETDLAKAFHWEDDQWKDPEEGLDE